MTLDDLVKIGTVLMEAKAEGDICAEHDVLYLPWSEQIGDVADKLEALGCHWESRYDCWARFT